MVEGVEISRCERKTGKGRCRKKFSVYAVQTDEIVEALRSGEIPQPAHAGAPGERICAACAERDRRAPIR